MAETPAAYAPTTLPRIWHVRDLIANPHQTCRQAPSLRGGSARSIWSTPHWPRLPLMGRYNGRHGSPPRPIEEMPQRRGDRVTTKPRLQCPKRLGPGIGAWNEAELAHGHRRRTSTTIACRPIKPTCSRATERSHYIS